MVINPQSNFGSVSLRRQGQARYGWEDRGDHGVPTCREAGVIKKANGTSGYSTTHIAELCNGSTYDSDSYCLGSSPSSPAISLHGQAVKTLPSQGKIMGSIPIGGATKQNVFVLFFCCSVFFKLCFPPSVFIKSLYRILHLCQVFLRAPSFAFSMECAG